MQRKHLLISGLIIAVVSILGWLAAVNRSGMSLVPKGGGDVASEKGESDGKRDGGSRKKDDTEVKNTKGSDHAVNSDSAAHPGSGLLNPSGLLTTELSAEIQTIRTGEFYTALDTAARKNLSLSEEEAQLLLDDMRTWSPPKPEEAEPGQAEGGRLVIWNEVLSLLSRQGQHKAQIFPQLIDTASREQTVPSLRGYMVQHLSVAYENDSQGAYREDLMGLFRRSALDPHPEVQGTALLALHRLNSYDGRKNGQEQVDPALRSAALNLAQDDATHVQTRITALQICGKENIAQAGELAAGLARNGSTIGLRIAAVCTLADLNQTGEIPFLESLLADPNQPRLHHPARAALARLK